MHNLNIQVGEAFKFVTDQNLDTMKKNLRSVYTGERLNAIWRTWMIKNTILPCYWSKVVNCAGLLLRWQWGYSGWFAGHPLLASKNHCYTKTTNLLKPSMRDTIHWACRGHAGADTWAGRHASAHSVARKRRQSNCTEIYCTIFPIHNLHPIPSRTNTQEVWHSAVTLKLHVLCFEIFVG